jgi:hypothetical protein
MSIRDEMSEYLSDTGTDKPFDGRGEISGVNAPYDHSSAARGNRPAGTLAEADFVECDNGHAVNRSLHGQNCAVRSPAWPELSDNSPGVASTVK